MSEPIEYLIVRDVQAALQAATVAGGYHYGIALAAVKLDPNHEAEEMVAPDGPRPYVLIEVLPDAWQYAPSNDATLATKLNIHWVHETDPTRDEDLLRRYYRGCADVERALMQDISRGGRAVDTRITSRACGQETDGAQVWATLTVEIHQVRTCGAPDGA